jgi:hypothetical protein
MLREGPEGSKGGLSADYVTPGLRLPPRRAISRTLLSGMRSSGPVRRHARYQPTLVRPVLQVSFEKLQFLCWGS